MGDTFSLFLPLKKVVEQADGTCMVYTRGVQELAAGDVGGEIFDYDTSKPNLEAWSADVFKRSGGKSYGNIRAMHGKQAAGKLDEPLIFNDIEKAVDLVVKVVDPVDVKKCIEGVYTGMSIGGKYGKRWRDPKNHLAMRYTAVPKEFSLVDLPAVPTATFSLVKADGSEELRKFAGADDTTPVSVAAQYREGVEEFAPTPEGVQEPAPTGLVAAPINSPSGAPAPLAHGVESVTAKTFQVPAHDAAPEELGKFIELLSQLGFTAGPGLKQQELQKAWGTASGIQFREGSQLQPNPGYPFGEREYGDPANWQYAYDSPEHCSAGLQRYNSGLDKAVYDPREWNVLGRRIAARAQLLLGKQYQYDPVTKRVLGDAKVSDTLNKDMLAQAIGNLRTAAQSAMENVNKPEAATAALHQIFAGLDIAMDAAGLNTQPKQPEGEKLAMAAAAASSAPSSSTAATTPSPEMKKIDELAARLDALVSVIEKAASASTAPASSAASTAPASSKAASSPMAKNLPAGALGLVEAEPSNDMSPLEKSQRAAAARASEGIGADHIQAILKEAGGDYVLAQNRALDLVRDSLAKRGFTSAAKIRLLDPAVIAALSGKSSLDNTRNK